MKDEGDYFLLCIVSGLLFVWPTFRIGVPDSVFSANKGVSSVDAWYSTNIDIEEVLSNTRQLRC